MNKIKKPKIKIIVFPEEKQLKSLNMFYYGILLDKLYINNSLMENLQVYVSLENTQILCFIQFKNKKLSKQFIIDLFDISGISDKPLKEDHKKIQKSLPDIFYLGVQFNQKLEERGLIYDEIMFIFEQESTKKIFWQGLQNVFQEAKKEFLQCDIQISQQLKIDSSLELAQIFIKQRLPQISQYYLEYITSLHDNNFLDKLQTEQIIEIMKEININVNFLNIFQTFQKEYFPDSFEPSMTFPEFQNFQKKYQNDQEYTDIFLLQKLRKINPQHDIRKEQISFYDFCYILQDHNTILKQTDIHSQTVNLNELYFFHEVFKGDNLLKTIINTLEKGCIYFQFKIKNGNLQIPYFCLDDQQEDSQKVINLFFEKISIQDSFLMIHLDIQCNNEQLNELIGIIQKKISKYIFQNSQTTLANLKQKIIFFGENSNLEFQKMTFPDFQFETHQQAQQAFLKNQKNLTNENKLGVKQVKGKDFKFIDFLSTGYQIITIESKGIEKLLQLSLFQKPDMTDYQNFVQKPKYLIETPGKFVHLDFKKTQAMIQVEILTGFQLGCEPCYLQIQIKGLNSDETKNGVYISRTITNGMKCDFNTLLKFEINCPFFAFILIQIYKKNDKNDELFSWTALKFDQLKQGIRKIYLRDLNFTTIPDSYLMANVTLLNC